MTMAAGVGALEDEAYFRANCQAIMDNRAWTTDALDKLGFETLPSLTNFVFTKNPTIAGKALYEQLKTRGILVRHFDTPRLTDYIRVTIGSREQMNAFIAATKEILEEIK
jgi:histidinol-phosphate aminotransferase